MLTQEQYEERRRAKYERFVALAEKNERAANQEQQTAQAMSEVIPLGQPILVGHYSEKSDRRYRERIHHKFRKGYELHQKASYYQDRANSVENNKAIFSDDPSAVDQLTKKIADLEELQDLMKAANKLVRKNDRDGLLKLGLTETQVTKLFIPDFAGRVGFPSYAITNNGAEIRRLKERAERVAHKQAQEDRTEEIDGVKIEYSPSENRIRIYFGARVEMETYKLLKQHGYRPLRSEGEGAFSAYYNNNALWFIQSHFKKEAANG